MSTTLTKLGDDGARQAGDLIMRAIQTLADHDKARPDTDGARLFFPDGIDMISVKFKLGTAVDISLAISGKSCCKSAALAAAATGADAGGEVGAGAFMPAPTFGAPNAARRSVEADSTDCLIEAVANITGVEVGPEELSELKPADVDVEDDLKWLRCLNKAAQCLRRKGYTIEDFPSAGELYGKVLDASLGALIDRVQIQGRSGS